MHRSAASPRIRDRIALALLAVALAVRMLVPAGWMPADGRGGVAITLCSGAGAVAAWVDAEGKIHKQDPASGAMPDHPCAFAGLGMPMLGGEPVPPVLLATAPRSEIAVIPPASAAIGRGLAAPPPPATGPPASL